MLCFDESLGQFSDSTALFPGNNEQLSYSDLDAKVTAFAGVFPTEKQLVFILSETNVQTIVAYLATLPAGQVAVLLNAGIEASAFDSLLQQYQPEWIFERVQTCHSYEYKENGHGLRRTHAQHHSIIHPDVALLLSTSGTTGSSKMVKLTKENLYHNATSIVEYLAIDKNERAISSLPLHYSYGLSVLNSHLAVGASIVLTDTSMMSRDFWNVLKEYKVTSFAGVPYHYEMLLRLKFFDMDLPDLKTLTQAGGRLSSKFISKFADHAAAAGLRFFVMYGQTEASPRISYVPADGLADNPESIGVAIPGGKLWLQDSHGNVIEKDDEEGELVYEGPNVMMGYATCRDDLALGDQLHNILPTGDLAKRSANGYFSISGRLKRIIKIFGNRVNLDEVESLLRNKGYDALCGGEDNHLWVALTDQIVADDAKKYVTSALGVHHSAIQTLIVERFSTTASGKIDYQKIFSALQVH